MLAQAHDKFLKKTERTQPPAIQATLQDVTGRTNAKRKAEARALHGLIDEQFVLNLTLFEDVFRVICLGPVTITQP